MGSLPALSILKGPQEILRRKDEPLALNQIFEHTLQSIDSINNNNDKIPVIHGITLREGIPEIIFNNKAQPLSDINEQANQFARSIQRMVTAYENADGDTVIAVDMLPTPNLVIALLAVWKLGAAYLPLDAGFPNSRVQHILQESRPTLVITENQDSGDRYDGTVVKTFKDLQQNGELLSTENLPKDINWTKRIRDEDQIAIILYTSGSTGVPKGVRLPHRVVLNRLKWQWKSFPYSATENVFAFKTALTFVDAVPELWGPLLWGRSLLILTKDQIIDTEAFVTAIDKYKIERIVLVPTLLRSILLYIGMVSNEKTPFRPGDSMRTQKHLSSLRLCVSSGEPLPVPLAQKFYQFFNADQHMLLNFYGSTECMGDVLYQTVTNVESLSPGDKIPLGIPLDNTNIYILDKHFRPVTVGQVGEIYTSGLNTAAGYVNGREPHRFLDNPLAIDPAHRKMYRTGDYGRMEKGVVYCEGRTDSQIKVRGHKVDLSEVEAAVNKLSPVDKAVILCYNAGHIDQALLAFVTTKLPDLRAKNVEEELQKLLPPYMVPQVLIVPHIPLLVNGKVDRQFLLKNYEDNFKKDTLELTTFDYSDIPNGYQSKAKALFETIAQVLHHGIKENITASSSFYKLGGNSLNSILVVTKLRDLGFVISIGEFISAYSLLEVVLRMNEEEAAVAGESLQNLSKIPEGKYSTQVLDDSHKSDTIRIITDSFNEKADLEKWLAPNIKKEDYTELIEVLWEPMLKQKLCYAVKNKEGQIIAVSLNMDAHNEPDVTITSKLTIVFEFLEFLEGPYRDNVLPKGTGQLMHSFMMGTAAFVQPQQNIELMQFMEYENIKLARKHGFAGIFTTNTSPLTQQLGVDVFEYQVLNDYQINKYSAADGSKPFGKAPDSDRCIVSWKPIEI